MNHTWLKIPLFLPDSQRINGRLLLGMPELRYLQVTKSKIIYFRFILSKVLTVNIRLWFYLGSSIPSSNVDPAQR